MAKFDHAVIYNGKLYRAGEEVPSATKKRKSKTNCGVSKNDIQSNNSADSGAVIERE